MKVASVDEIPLRAEPSETVKEEAAAAAAKAAEAKAEAERAAAAKAEKVAEVKAAKAAEAAAKAEKAEAAKRDELQKLVEREEAEAVAKEAAAKESAAKAKAEAKAEARAKAEAKAEAEAEAKAEAQQKLAEAKAKAESDAKAKADAVAKARAEAAAKAKVKAMAEAKAKADAEAKARKQAELAEKYSPGDIKELLANKAPSQSTGATGREVQRTASLGTTTGNAQKLSPSLRDALVGMLQQQIERCYSAPPGAAQGVILPMLDIKLNADGSLTSEAADPALGPERGRPVDRPGCAPRRAPLRPLQDSVAIRAVLQRLESHQRRVRVLAGVTLPSPLRGGAGVGVVPPDSVGESARPPPPTPPRKEGGEPAAPPGPSPYPEAIMTQHVLTRRSLAAAFTALALTLAAAAPAQASSSCASAGARFSRCRSPSSTLRVIRASAR